MALLLESGLGRLSELASEAAGKLLPKVVHLLVPLVSLHTAHVIVAPGYTVLHLSDYFPVLLCNAYKVGCIILGGNQN